MAFDFSKVAWHKTFSLTAFNLSTDQIVMSLSDLQTCNLMFNGTNVFSMGSAGEKIVSFAHTGEVNLEAVSSLYEFGAMGQILGATPAVGSTSGEVIKVEDLTVTSNTATTLYTALGTAGAELKYAYILNSDGSRSTELTQGAVAAAGVFSYTPGTKTITLNSGQVADNGKIRVAYVYTTGSSTTKLTKFSNVFSKSVKIVLDGTVRDQCNEVDYLAQCIIYKMKLTNEMSIETSGTGDPATLNVSGEGMKRCADNVMCNIYIIDASEST